jgi:hypothetical protein
MSRPNTRKKLKARVIQLLLSIEDAAMTMEQMEKGLIALAARSGYPPPGYLQLRAAVHDLSVCGALEIIAPNISPDMHIPGNRELQIMWSLATRYRVPMLHRLAVLADEGEK